VSGEVRVPSPPLRLGTVGVRCGSRGGVLGRRVSVPRVVAHDVEERLARRGQPGVDDANREGGLGDGIVGEAAIDLIRQFKVDFGIIGISGIDADGTLLDFDYREVRVAQAIIEHSRKVLLAADHSKFGRSAMVRLGHLSQVHALFTDRAPPREIGEILQHAGVELCIAGPT